MNFKQYTPRANRAEETPSAKYANVFNAGVPRKQDISPEIFTPPGDRSRRKSSVSLLSKYQTKASWIRERLQEQPIAVSLILRSEYRTHLMQAGRGNRYGLLASLVPDRCGLRTLSALSRSMRLPASGRRGTRRGA
jgi:hypothetical protein